ncbi:plasmid partition protein ParG [Pseudobutyrivibrio sp.]
MQINKVIFYDFKVKCKERGLPLNIVIEVFMNQYANRKYHLDREAILKWKEDFGETETLNSTFNKETYVRFKDAVKSDGLFIKHVITAFVEDYVKNDLVMEYATKR